MEFYSNLAAFIIGFVEQKRALGYKYQSEVGILKRFDKFCIAYHPNEFHLSREIVLHWATKQPNEKPATLQGRVTPVNELAKYMIRIGENAFILPKGTLPLVTKYIPHIYTDAELQRLFQHIDNCKYCSEVPLRHLVMPVFFRVLYCCGLRLSEARLLKIKDVDLDKGIITVTNSKFDKHRQIPVSDSLKQRMCNFSNHVHLCTSKEDWFFPGYKNKAMTMGNVEKIYIVF